MNKCFLLLIALYFSCSKDKVIELDTSPPPSTNNYFAVTHGVYKETGYSFWGIILTSNEDGVIFLKTIINTSFVLSSVNKNKISYYSEETQFRVGDTLWFSRYLEDDPYLENRFNYNRCDQQMVLAKTVVQ